MSSLGCSYIVTMPLFTYSTRPLSFCLGLEKKKKPHVWTQVYITCKKNHSSHHHLIWTNSILSVLGYKGIRFGSKVHDERYHIGLWDWFRYTTQAKMNSCAPPKRSIPPTTFIYRNRTDFIETQG